MYTRCVCAVYSAIIRHTFFMWQYLRRGVVNVHFTRIPIKSFSAARGWLWCMHKPFLRFFLCFQLSSFSPSHIYLTCNCINKYIIAEAAMNLQIVFVSVVCVFFVSLVLFSSNQIESVRLSGGTVTKCIGRCFYCSVQKNTYLFILQDRTKNVSSHTCKWNAKCAAKNVCSTLALIINSIDCTWICKYRKHQTKTGTATVSFKLHKFT